MSLITKSITLTVTADRRGLLDIFEPGTRLPPQHVTLPDREDLKTAIMEAEVVTVTAAEEVRQYRLHVGMLATQYIRADHRVWQSDGDGWNSWGDDPGIDGNDLVTVHVMHKDLVTADQADRIVNEVLGSLRPITTHHAGVVATLSDPDMWSENQDVEWYADGVRRTPGETPKSDDGFGLLGSYIVGYIGSKPDTIDAEAFLTHVINRMNDLGI